MEGNSMSAGREGGRCSSVKTNTAACYRTTPCLGSLHCGVSSAVRQSFCCLLKATALNRHREHIALRGLIFRLKTTVHSTLESRDEH